MLRIRLRGSVYRFVAFAGGNTVSMLFVNLRSACSLALFVRSYSDAVADGAVEQGVGRSDPRILSGNASFLAICAEKRMHGQNFA